MEKEHQGRMRDMGDLKKAPPPPAPTNQNKEAEEKEKKKLMKAPPTNLLTPKPEEEAKESMEVTISEENSRSEESEECEKMQEGPIDIEQYEYVTGAQIRAKNAIAEERDVLGRNRYIEKQRISKTIKIIGGPGKMNTIYRDLLSETTQEVLYDMGR